MSVFIVIIYWLLFIALITSVWVDNFNLPHILRDYFQIRTIKTRTFPLFSSKVWCSIVDTIVFNLPRCVGYINDFWRSNSSSVSIVFTFSIYADGILKMNKFDGLNLVLSIRFESASWNVSDQTNVNDCPDYLKKNIWNPLFRLKLFESNRKH